MLAGFVGPLGLNQLLKYMETNGEGAVIRPWVWIAWLFVGPTVSSLANEYYLHVTGRTMIRAEAIITQLIFEHALRIRIKAETETVRRTGGSSITEAADDRANMPRSGLSKDKQTWKRQPIEKTSHKSNHLIGLINNLVTTDLGNITDARDFLYAGL